MDYLEILNESELEIEAINRMTILDIQKELISDFLLHRTVFCSELASVGILNPCPFVKKYELEEDTLKMIEDFEQEYKCLVYHTIKTLTDTGTIYNLFYVRENKEDWETQQDDIYASLPFVATINFSSPENVEFGQIQVGHLTGGLYNRFYEER
ncbi:hypothetical protein [Enterococcus plantarum]|uniref:hypothetical protein n=1 Tax=Enterococcus plantarum TaxID=1077675 RepID=UPI001A8E644C|nr:hypothetical protein [Enterococcus plantarum]MBO0423406.1 hypothetical protein [Enterococcus plantarum]